jgi:ABC-type dipeptide/oligopeptide/nickel transport system ATPase subunit
MGFWQMLEARELTAGFAGAAVFRAVSLRLAPGGILGLSGRSGMGKTTLGRVLAGLHPPLSGELLLDGSPHGSPHGFLRPQSRLQPVQYLHQHPLGAMNPRWRIARVLAEAGPVDPQLCAALGVGMDWFARFPHELSGGQLQRVSILRALGARPRYLIADEITASLDALGQARIWWQLRRIAAEQRVGILAISHDQALLGQICSCGNIELEAPVRGSGRSNRSVGWLRNRAMLSG